MMLYWLAEQAKARSLRWLQIVLLDDVVYYIAVREGYSTRMIFVFHTRRFLAYSVEFLRVQIVASAY